MDHILMLLCFLIMVATLPVSAATVNGRAMLEDRHEKRDVEALLENHIKLDPSGRLFDWTAENSQNVCSWHGVTGRKHTRRVVAVILPVLVPLLNSKKLDGTLSASLDNLSLLQTLNLNGNNLTRGIPPDFGQLKALGILDLSWNYLGGSITKALCNCTRLKSIKLSWNSFTETIPIDFGRLVELEQLDLSVNNYLGGSIPTSLTNCTSLRQFSIASNNFTGPIPSTLGSIKRKFILT